MCDHHNDKATAQTVSQYVQYILWCGCAEAGHLLPKMMSKNVPMPSLTSCSFKLNHTGVVEECKNKYYGQHIHDLSKNKMFQKSVKDYIAMLIFIFKDIVPSKLQHSNYEIRQKNAQ